MKTYWTLWLITAFPITFLIPEAIALKRGRPQDTLSWYLWHLEDLQPGQPFSQWTAAHILIGGTLAVVLIWLLAHLILGIWT